MKKLVLLFLFTLISACGGSYNVKEQVCNCEEGEVITGTNTAVVKISIGKDGMPRVSSDVVVVEIGQRIVWAGPTKMEIRFPKGSPFDSRVLKTSDGVINRVLPDVKFDGKEKKYKYDVVVNGKVLDPIMILRRPQ